MCSVLQKWQYLYQSLHALTKSAHLILYSAIQKQCCWSSAKWAYVFRYWLLAWGMVKYSANIWFPCFRISLCFIHLCTESAHPLPFYPLLSVFHHSHIHAEMILLVDPPAWVRNVFSIETLWQVSHSTVPLGNVPQAPKSHVCSSSRSQGTGFNQQDHSSL